MTRKYARWLIGLFLAGVAQFAHCAGSSEAPAPSGDDQVMDEVVITGEWPGPQLWKVSSGDHVVWILGTLTPLPKRMTWKYADVENVIADSQQVIGKTNVRPKVSIFGWIPLYFQFRKVAKLPDKQTLKDVLPADLYQRYATLVQRYRLDGGDFERLRPIVAALRLYQAVIEANDLTNKNDVHETVLKLAEAHDVPLKDVTIKVSEPREVLKDVSELPRSAEIACFTDVVSGLETDLPLLKKRASAWARGDVDTLRKLVTAKERSACRDALFSVESVKAVSDEAKSGWFKVVAYSLEHNKSALALSPVYDLISKGGGLDQLRAAGYQVEGP